jgi:glutamate-1-semialdehyde 2,1-aminomutase
MMLTTLPAFVLNSGRFGVGCFVAARFSDRQRRSRIIADWIRAYLICMGPLYIKVGQVLSTRSDMLPADMQDVLSTLQDDVPGMPDKALQDILVRAYGPDWRETLLNFSSTPIASGSIAQVHEARLRTGERVAVKIVKHGVVDSLKDNLRIVGFSLRLIHKLLRPVRFLDLPERFDEIAKLLSVQVDMEEEQRNQQAIYDAFQGHPYIKIPRLYSDLCRDNILVMDFFLQLAETADRPARPGCDLHDALPRRDLSRRSASGQYVLLGRRRRHPG